MCLQALLQYQTTKPKKVGWKMPIASYLLLCMSFASASASWERCQASPMAANQWLCMFVMSVLGTKLARRLKISRSSFLLPYVYITMKAKCWCQALRVCRKPFHSCVRKVYSYATGKANVRFTDDNIQLEPLALKLRLHERFIESNKSGKK